MKENRFYNLINPPKNVLNYNNNQNEPRSTVQRLAFVSQRGYYRFSRITSFFHVNIQRSNQRTKKYSLLQQHDTFSLVDLKKKTSMCKYKYFYGTTMINAYTHTGNVVIAN